MKITIDDSMLIGEEMLIGGNLTDKIIEIVRTLLCKARANKKSAKIVEFVKMEILTDCVQFQIVLNPFNNSEEYRKIKFFVTWLGGNALSYNEPSKHTLGLALSSNEPEIVADGLFKIMKIMLLEKGNHFESERRYLEDAGLNFMAQKT